VVTITQVDGKRHKRSSIHGVTQGHGVVANFMRAIRLRRRRFLRAFEFVFMTPDSRRRVGVQTQFLSCSGGASMKIDIIKPTIKRATFTLKGKSCNEIVEELNKKSPGHFKAHPKFHVEMNASDRSIKSVTISAHGTIKLPAWAGAKSLGPKTLKEWKRFQEKLEVHEEGHRLILLESMAIIAEVAHEWYEEKVKQGEVPTGDALDEKYKTDWYGKYWDPPQDKYDADTERGKTQGAWFEAVRCD
jgi:hypothetical protein